MLGARSKHDFSEKALAAVWAPETNRNRQVLDLMVFILPRSNETELETFACECCTNVVIYVYNARSA